MDTKLVRLQTPEERELEKKLAELALLQDRLAEREIELATLQAELQAFENLYLREVGRLFAELDDIEARIAEELAKRRMNDKTAQDRADGARTKANESSRAAGNKESGGLHWRATPPESLKRLFRQIAKQIHPDLATNEQDRTYRTVLMAEASNAFHRLDEARLSAILSGLLTSPESASGGDLGARLIRVIRQIAQVEERLKQVAGEVDELKDSDLFRLKLEVEQAEKCGRNLLAEMASVLGSQISAARDRLSRILEAGSRV